MNKSCFSKSGNILLLLLIISAFILRLINVWFAYPLPVHPDEPFLVEAALKILATGDLNPHIFFYPSLNIYLQAMLFYLITLPQRMSETFNYPSQLIDYYICGRILNVVISTCTIYIVYEIGKRLFNTRTGLVAVCFISVSSLHVTNSYFATVDTPTALWSSVACLMAVMIYTNGGKCWYYIVGGICVGLAIGSKYTAFPSCLPILVAHIFNARSDKNWLSKNFILCLFTIPITFLISTPYAILDIRTFIGYIIYQSQAYKSYPGATSLTGSSLSQYISYLYNEGFGKIPFVLALIGGVFLLIKNRYKIFILVSCPMVVLLFIGMYPVYFTRNVVPIIPFISVLSGYCICQGSEWIEQQLSFMGSFKNIKVTMLVISVMLVLISIQNQIRIDVKQIKENLLPDTRWVSLKWIENNIPHGAIIGREHYTPPIEVYTDKYRVMSLDYFGVVKNINIIPLLDYMVVSDGDYSRFIDNPNKFKDESRIYNSFFLNNELIKEFKADRKSMTGPKIKIYKIKH